MKRGGLERLSWISYDFSNTIFSMVAVSFAFPLYMKELTGRDVWTGAANSLSMLLAAAPVLAFVRVPRPTK